MDIKSRIGFRIKQLREQKAFSQQDLAYVADLDRSYVASIETGARNVSIVNIEKIARALDVSIKEFFNTNEFDNLSGIN